MLTAFRAGRDFQVKAVMEVARRWWFQPAQNLDGKAEPKMLKVQLAF